MSCRHTISCRPGLYRLSLFLLLLAALGWGSCKKSAFLDVSENASLIIPNTIEGCQALLDNDVVMNGFGKSGYPYLGQLGSDDYYSTPDQFANYTVPEQQAVAWLQGISSDAGLNDWSLGYRVVYTANQALAGLPALSDPAKQAAWNQVKGGALFFRAFAYYQLAQIFAPVYDSVTALADPGICLRRTADVSEKFTRASVQATYDQILSDLAVAGPLLPADSAWYPTRPSKVAVYGLLARIWLCIRDYRKAYAYSDSCLQIQSSLMQYDTISVNSAFPFSRFNPEVIFSAAYLSSGPTATREVLGGYPSLPVVCVERSPKPAFFQRGELFFRKI